MTRLITVVLGVVLSVGTVLAQPAPKKKKAPKTPVPAQKAPDPAPAPTPPPDPTPPLKKDEPGGGGGVWGDKAETLGAGTERPWATGVSQDRQDAAIRLFVEGNGYLNDGIFTKAVESYRGALTSWDHPAIHYNMALALTKLDQPIEVEISLEKAIAYGPSPLETPDKFEHAKEYLVLNAKQLAWIEVSCDKVGAKVSIDNEEVFTVATGKDNKATRRVKVGKHTIVAEKTGYNATVEPSFIEPGQKFAINITLYTSDELRRTRRRWDARWMPYAVIGGGVVLGGVGALMQLSAQSSYDDYDKEIARCNADSGGVGCASSESITDLKESGNSKRTLGYVGYGLAGAAVITGAVLIYLNRETEYEITADEYKKQQREKPVAITPVVAPGMAGAMVFGRF
jgi:hypothetical protein